MKKGSKIPACFFGIPSYKKNVCDLRLGSALDPQLRKDREKMEKRKSLNSFDRTILPFAVDSFKLPTASNYSGHKFICEHSSLLSV